MFITQLKIVPLAQKESLQNNACASIRKYCYRSKWFCAQLMKNWIKVGDSFLSFGTRNLLGQEGLTKMASPAWTLTTIDKNVNCTVFDLLAWVRCSDTSFLNCGNHFSLILYNFFSSVLKILQKFPIVNKLNYIWEKNLLSITVILLLCQRWNLPEEVWDF